MSSRTNPWPAFVDLFSALLIASFAGFIMLAGAYRHQVGGIEAEEKAKEALREETRDIIRQVKQSLAKDAGIPFTDCGDDTCINLYIHFSLNQDAISDGDKKTLAKACQVLKSALDRLPVERRREIELIIEGHTDNRPVSHPSDPRADFRFNWDLSSRRATSVLYEFGRMGLAPPRYQVVAIGYADSMPLCTRPAEDCYASNRRTTLRLRANTQLIEHRLRQ